MWSSQEPMVVHLVGLGGSLEGRVAGVVLVLVGCRKELAGQSCCSYSACAFPFHQYSCHTHILLQFPMLFLARGAAPVSQSRRGERKRTGSESGGERVDAVCDDQACDRNRFSSPFSLKEVYPQRARSRFSSIRVGGVLGYRTGSVERPHGLDCN